MVVFYKEGVDLLKWCGCGSGVFFVDFFLVLISVARFFAELERVCEK